MKTFKILVIFPGLLFLFLFSFFHIPLQAESPVNSGSSFLPKNIAVPESIGKIQERFTGKTGRMIIQIQDVHAHATAQENIAAILEHIQVVGKISTVALEGAWMTTDLPKSHALPTSREKQLLARTLLDEDLISGPIYAALLAPSPLTLWGIESPVGYEKNREIYLEHLQKSEAIYQKIKIHEEKLKNLEMDSWNPKLLAFGKAFEAFRDTSDLGKFFPVLLKASATYEVEMGDLAQVTLTQQIMELEKSISKERLDQEAKQLIRAFKDTPWNLEELIRGNQIPPEKLGFYPEIKKLRRLFTLRDQIVLSELMNEIESLTQRVLTKLIRTPDEGELWERVERFSLAKRILLLKAMPNDLKAYQEEKSALAGEIQKSGLASEMALTLDFYDIVQMRDQRFFEAIMKTPPFEGPAIVLVTGGFHTDGLSQRFRDAGISYITIAPDLGNEPMNEKLYRERMQESFSQDPASNQQKPAPAQVENQTLSELRNALAWVDERFYRAYAVLTATRDVRTAVAAFLGNETAIAKASSPLKPPTLQPAISAKLTIPPASHEFNMEQFMAEPKEEQQHQVRGLLEEVATGRQKAMLVSTVSVMTKLAENARVPNLVSRMTENGDALILLQDLPARDIPETLKNMQGVKYYEAADLSEFVGKNTSFRQLAKKFPFAIMKEGYQNERYVVLPENWISLVVYRIIVLSPNLYRAAKNPVFLDLLGSLASEILSQELPKKAA